MAFTSVDKLNIANQRAHDRGAAARAAAAKAAAARTSANQPNQQTHDRGATRTASPAPSAKKTSTATYAPPTYNDGLYSRGINTSFYTNAINTYRNQANADRANQIKEAGTQRDTALKQAYITRAQNDRALQNAMATAGIRGGATETSNLKLANQYATDRSTANTNYQNSVNSINQAIDKNIADYTADMQSRAEEYRQNIAQARWQAAREDYWNKVNAQREDKQNKIKNDQDKLNATIERYNAYYTDTYSNTSKDAAKKKIKEVDKKLKKKGLSMTERAKLEQQKRALNVRLAAIRAEEKGK